MTVKKKTEDSNAFKNWINEVGTIELARLLGVNDATVRHWRRGHCVPKSEQMARIRKLSRGAVSYEAMIDSHLKKLRAKKN